MENKGCIEVKLTNFKSAIKETNIAMLEMLKSQKWDKSAVLLYCTFANWNPEGKRVEQTDFSAPKPTKILARIYPQPGKIVVTPCFMVHRIQPLVTRHRWAIVTFIDNPNYRDKNKKMLEQIYKRYFNEYSRN